MRRGSMFWHQAAVRSFVRRAKGRGKAGTTSIENWAPAAQVAG